MALKETKIVLMGKQILTIHDTPYEDDAFKYSYLYYWDETILNKERLLLV